MPRRFASRAATRSSSAAAKKRPIPAGRSWRSCRKRRTMSACPHDAVHLVETADRAAVGHFLALPQLIDVAIPRGGESLIRRVAAEAQMPVIKHFTGNCHVYVDRSADLAMAERITINSKCQRTGVCNACESLLVHRDLAATFLPQIAPALAEPGGRNPRLRGDLQTGARRRAGDRRRLRGRVPGADHLGQGGRRPRRGRSSTSTATARSTPTRSSPATWRRPASSRPASIAPR